MSSFMIALVFQTVVIFLPTPCSHINFEHHLAFQGILIINNNFWNNTFSITLKYEALIFAHMMACWGDTSPMILKHNRYFFSLAPVIFVLCRLCRINLNDWKIFLICHTLFQISQFQPNHLLAVWHFYQPSGPWISVWLIYLHVFYVPLKLSGIGLPLYFMLLCL